MAKVWLTVLALVMNAGAFFFLGDRESSISRAVADIPENYYFSLKPTDVDSPIELVRFASSIRPETNDLSISQRVAYFE